MKRIKIATSASPKTSEYLVSIWAPTSRELFEKPLLFRGLPEWVSINGVKFIPDIFGFIGGTVTEEQRIVLEELYPNEPDWWGNMRQTVVFDLHYDYPTQSYSILNPRKKFNNEYSGRVNETEYQHGYSWTDWNCGVYIKASSFEAAVEKLLKKYGQL